MHVIILNLLLYNPLFNFFLCFNSHWCQPGSSLYHSLHAWLCVITPAVGVNFSLPHISFRCESQCKWSHVKMELEPPFQRNSFAHPLFWNFEQDQNTNITRRQQEWEYPSYKSELCQVTILPDHLMKCKSSLCLSAPRNLPSLILLYIYKYKYKYV